MKKIIFSIFLLTLAANIFATSNPAYAIFAIPEALLENAHTVIRLEEQAFEVQSQTKAVERNHYVISVLNIQSDMDKITIYYDGFNKVRKAYCKVYNALGQEIQAYKQKDFSDQSAVNSFSLYTDSRVKYLDLGHFSPPFTVEYGYETTHEQGFQAYPQWQQDYEISVEKVNITCLLPPNYKIQSKTYNIDLQPQVNQQDAKQKHHWQIENLPAKEREPLSPPRHEVLPMLVITPQVFELEGLQGSYESWQKFGHFVAQLNAERDELSPEMAQKVKELTENISTDAEKIAILYQYLKDNTRYVNVSIGVGGWQTYDAHYVEENKYGDCKALSNFMKSMLKAADISSNMVLISSGRASPLAEDFPLARFNHMILYVPSEDMWLECTSKGNPPGYVGKSNADRKVLVVDIQNSKLSHLPAIEKNQSTHNLQLVLDAKGTANLQNKAHTTGAKHEIWRSYKTYLSSKEEMIERYRERSDLPSFSINTFEIDVSETVPEASYTIDFDIPKYASKAGKRLFVPLNKISGFKNLLPEDDSRLAPVVRKSAYQDVMNATIQLPENYVIESLPQNQTIETEFGNYELTITRDENTVSLKRKLDINAFEVTAERYEEVRDFYKQISKLDNAQLVLKAGE